MIACVMAMSWAAIPVRSTVAMRDYGVTYTELTLDCVTELLSRGVTQ